MSRLPMLLPVGVTIPDDVVDDVQTDVNVLLDRWVIGQLGWPDLIAAAVVCVVAALLGQLTRRLVKRSTKGWDTTAVAAADVSGRLVAIGIYLLAGAVVLDIIGFGTGPVMILLLVGFVLFITLRPLLENLVSGLVITIRGAFQPGELVEIDGEFGVVDEVSSRAVILARDDGPMIFIPNSQVVDSKVTNYTRLGRRRSSLRFTLAGPVDPTAVGDRMERLVADLDDVLDDPPPTVLVAELAGSRLCFDVYYWHGSSVADEVAAMWAVGQALTETDLEFADQAIVIADGGSERGPRRRAP